MGGWSEVLALRRRGERIASDARILGDGEFVERVIEEWDEVGKANLRLNRLRMDLPSLAKRVCKKWGATIGELRSGSRRHVISEAREEFVQVAVKELGFSGAAVARYIGVTASCVTRIAGSRELREEVRSKYQIL